LDGIYALRINFDDETVARKLIARFRWQCGDLRHAWQAGSYHFQGGDADEEVAGLCGALSAKTVIRGLPVHYGKAHHSPAMQNVAIGPSRHFAATHHFGRE
jgi:hypothetical protein